ncbi:MAG: hypothetical protein AAFN74_04960 [Myxococcota bacterium]
MTLLRMHGSVAIAMSGALALVGCSGDESPPNNNNMGMPDTGVVDSGQPDSGIFVPDTGVVPDPEEGTEGFACDSTFTPEDTTVRQDNCDPGLLCMPWDELSGNPLLTGPVQSCVRPCDVDQDCGTNDDNSPRFCVETIFNEASGVGRICVDELSEAGGFCGLSKLAPSQFPNVPLRTLGRQVGCTEDADCRIDLFSNLVHPDEGVCVRICDSDDECAAPTPFCNPGALQGVQNGEPVAIGLCTDRPRGVGSLCGTSDVTNTGLTSGCDTSSTAVATECIRNPAITGVPVPDGLGVCTPVCNDELACELVDPVLGETTCSEPFITFGTSTVAFGVCGNGCTQFPDTCGDMGGQGAGRFCDGSPVPGSLFCVDVIPEPLTPGMLVDSTPDLNVGDNCVSATEPLALSCPAGSSCYIVNAAGTQGRCFFGCSRAPEADPEVCNQLLNVSSSTCAAALQDESVGLCEAN